MKQRMCSVFDNGVNVWGAPFFVPHVQYALRYFETLARDVKSDVSKFPSQFHLFELGEFDEDAGTFVIHSVPVSLGLASSFLKPEVENAS